MRLIKLDQVIQQTALSRSQIYVMMNRGEFPKPAKVSARLNAWAEPEIQDWCIARLAQRDASAA